MSDTIDTAPESGNRLAYPSRFSFGTVIDGLEIHGEPASYPVMNDRAVRAAAGLMLIVAAFAFCMAFFQRVYWPIQTVTVFFAIDFALRVTTGLTPLSPSGLLGSWLVRAQQPEWVGATQKRFAWSMGLVMSFAMAIITNLDIRGTLPLTVCVICMSLMWMESALGVCVGCKIYVWLVKSKIIRRPEYPPVCPGDACDVGSDGADLEMTS